MSKTRAKSRRVVWPQQREDRPCQNRTWRDEAECRNHDPETWFPAAASGPLYELQVEAAKAICRTCPARHPCLTEALARGMEGVWGGTTDAERRELRARTA